jgi:hypothetical protein
VNSGTKDSNLVKYENTKPSSAASRKWPVKGAGKSKVRSKVRSLGKGEVKSANYRT